MYHTHTHTYTHTHAHTHTRTPTRAHAHTRTRARTPSPSLSLPPPLSPSLSLSLLAAHTNNIRSAIQPRSLSLCNILQSSLSCSFVGRHHRPCCAQFRPVQLAVTWYILAAASHRRDVISAVSGIGHPVLTVWFRGHLNGTLEGRQYGFLKRTKSGQTIIWVKPLEDALSYQFTFFTYLWRYSAAGLSLRK